ncbi:MAG: hypothetical protein QXX08_06135 [Candidatus Bathyarchaeia archaeon]
MDFNGFLEILILVAISIELYALYVHTKTDSRIDEHINNTNMRLERSDELMKLLDNHMLRLSEHMLRLDEHMNKINEHIDKLSEQMVRYSEDVKRLDDLILKISNYSAKNE